MDTSLRCPHCGALDPAKVEAALAARVATEKPAYSIIQAAAALGIGVQTVRGEVAAGRLPALRIAGRIVIKRQALDEWLSRQPGGDEEWQRNEYGPSDEEIAQAAFTNVRRMTAGRRPSRSRTADE
jgi:excisionase family DNA binding protein